MCLKAFFLKKMQTGYCKIEFIFVILHRETNKQTRYTMLEAFFKIHDYLIEQVQTPLRRQLMDEINWEDRLIAIKGGRGVGKTDFLLARAKALREQELREDELHRPRRGTQPKRRSLYVNFNNFYFTEHSLIEFTREFYKAGGRTLLLDQMFKYPNWSRELRRCHDRYQDLHIIFSASPVMRLVEDNKDIANIVHMYNLRGFSFREYLNLQTGLNLPVFTLEQVLKTHASISRELCETIHPLKYLRDYMEHGYYPAYLEATNFEEALTRTMNMMLEIDVLMIKQIDVACIPKLRKLLYIMLKDTPCALNISNISDEIELSRATTMNYIKYLKDARLLNLLYMQGKQFPSKPLKVYMQNTNLAHMIITRELDDQSLYETFFYMCLHGAHKVNATERSAMFVVDNQYYFDVRCDNDQRDLIRPTMIGNIETGLGNAIPLWLLGFLY